MENRRSFLKASALGIAGTSVAPFSKFLEQFVSQTFIVKQPEDCETFFVRENTPITFHLSKTIDKVSSVSLLSEELLPGSVIPMHKHVNTEEFFFFKQGTGVFTIDTETFPFQPGTMAFVPKNTWHEIKNGGNENVIFSFGFSPAGFEDFFREIGTPKGQPFKQKPKEERDAIAKKYGMIFK